MEVLILIQKNQINQVSQKKKCKNYNRRGKHMGNRRRILYTNKSNNKKHRKYRNTFMANRY
jgi:hypothetical protein